MEPNQPHRTFLPLINRGTFCRVYSIVSNVEKILKEIPKEKNVNIIILGSGFDTLYFNLMSKGNNNISFYEFDYNKVIAKKKQIIENSKLLKEVIGANTNYHLIECDISKISKLKEAIKNIPQETYNDFTIVVCECLLVYIERDKTVEILSNFRNVFNNIAVLTYDLIGANDEFGKEMVENLRTRNLHLKGFDDVPTNKEQIERMKECKFETVEFIDMLKVYQTLPPEERKRIDSLEMMDEFEEFDLLQKHACYGYGLSIKDNQFENMKNVLRIHQ